MNKCLRAMQQGNMQYKTLGLKKTAAEEKYRVALQKEIARLRLERDVADVNYETCRNSLRYCEKELEILRSQLAWLKSELNKTF